MVEMRRHFGIAFQVGLKCFRTNLHRRSLRAVIGGTFTVPAVPDLGSFAVSVL